MELRQKWILWQRNDDSGIKQPDLKKLLEHSLEHNMLNQKRLARLPDSYLSDWQQLSQAPGFLE